MAYQRLAPLKTTDRILGYFEETKVDIPFATEVDPAGALARSLTIGDHTVGNRFAALPMEGWDSELDGGPSEYSVRRWTRVGEGGCKFIWGGEATAVRHDGRSNDRQLMIGDSTLARIAGLRETLEIHHIMSMGTADDLFVGLQLTHSGRHSKPDGERAPLVAYNNPILDARAGGDVHVLTDTELDDLIGDYVRAARQAEEAGFHFVDIKHCHGYLLHELLSAYDRPGPYGGSFENRTRFLRAVVEGVRRDTSLDIGVRLSVADMRPYTMGEDDIGVPEDPAVPFGAIFGEFHDGVADLAPAKQFIDLMLSMNVNLLCTSVGSPYTTPHLTRPAAFPPSDGYLPPEDPLEGVARQLAIVRELKEHAPEMVIVGSGYSYLQQWLPNVAQKVIESGGVDFIGLGRMLLSYPSMPRDVLSGTPLETRQICRTLSDCTTSPRNGLISGCYPLDPFYKDLPQFVELRQIKKEIRTG